jgi:uncharacterized protein
MSSSLREQLLAAGLGSKKQAKQIEQQQHREQRDQKRDPKAAQAAEQQRAKSQAQAQAAKAARDQELNRKRQQEAEHRERWAQVRQLVEQHAIPRGETDEYFNFIDDRKVRRIYANAQQREQIISGSIVIIRCDGRYHLVPPDIAARIAERQPRAVISLQPQSDTSKPTAEEDPYKDFVVPDDLKW